MCWDILTNPGSALEKAKKSKNRQKAWIALIEASILFGLTAAVISFSVFNDALISASAFAGTLVLSIVVGIILGWIISITTTTLGGKGTFQEGLVAISYSILFFGCGFFVASILSLLPIIGQAIGAVVLLATAAVGMASLYRGIKEMFRTDMITAFVVVSIIILAVFIAIWGVLGLNLTGNLNSVLSTVAIR